MHNPLRCGVGRYPISLSLGRNYGFVHTSAEALQQLNYMFGHSEVPAEFHSLIFRPNTVSGFESKPHVPADIYFIELSSRKLFHIDGVPVQQNYVARRYQDFFAGKQRSRMFWSHSAPQFLGERKALLLQDTSFQRLGADDGELLSRIERRDMTDAEIERDMAALIAMVGADKIVFVTHVNADTPDGFPIERRQRLNQSVKAIARRLKVSCYDPTALMKDMGQVVALENGGLDLGHYTSEFSERLCADLYKRFVAARFGSEPYVPSSSMAVATAGKALEDIAAEWAGGGIVEASRRLHDYVRRYPDHHASRALLGEIRYELGDYEGARTQLEVARADADVDAKSDLLLMRAYFQTGEYVLVRKIAAQLLSEEIETPEIVRLCARASDRLQDANEALVHWKRLFRLKGGDTEAADAALTILAGKSDSIAAEEWAEEVQETMPSHQGAFAFRWKQGLLRGEREGLLAMAGQPVVVNEALALELAQLSAADGMCLPAAVLAETHRLQESTLDAVRTWMAECAAAWLSLGINAFESNQLLDAVDYLQSAWRIKPTNGAIIRARRALEQKMRRDVRQAFIAKNYREVIRISALANGAEFSFRGLNSLLGRAHFAVGNFEEAFTYLKRAASEDAASKNAVVQYARAASRSNQYGEALDTYSRILKSAEEGSGAYKEAANELARLEKKAVRAARERLAQGDAGLARTLLLAVRAVNPDSAAVHAEMQRMLVVLRAEVKALEPASAGRRLALGMEILGLDPEDAVGLRAAAVGAMRTHQYSDALVHWKSLRGKVADPSKIDLNIQKCLLWIERVKRKSAA